MECFYKEYFGSASEFQKVNVRTLKVRKLSFLIKRSLEDTLIEMQQDLIIINLMQVVKILEAIRKSRLCHR